ncbi:MAG: hypothetical protein K8R77_03140 [Anaerolineaceae bacterium]|nr:hypothetical protein [Anaerolineaceae bacterium]
MKIAEMLQDIQDNDSTKAALENGADELLPSEVIHTIPDGENTIRDKNPCYSLLFQPFFDV